MKLNELKQVNEMSKSIFSLDVTKMTTKELVDEGGEELAAVHGGHTNSVYGGYDASTKTHIYYLLWEDADAAEKPFAISIIRISLALGKTWMDVEEAPEFSNMTKDEAEKKLSSLEKAP